MTGILHLVETATTTSVGTQRTQNPQFKLSFSQFFALKARCNELSFYIRKELSWSNKCSVVTQKSNLKIRKIKRVWVVTRIKRTSYN